MVKPILITKISTEFLKLKVNEINEIEKHLRLKTDNEYHVLILSITGLKEVEFQVLNAEDITEVSIEELKEIIQKYQSESTKMDNF